MPDMYASAIGTTVLQLKEVPKRPAAFDGQLALYELNDGVDEQQIRASFGGEITKVEVTGWPSAIVHFASHEAATAAASAGTSVCKGQAMLYNELPYDRKGWCVPCCLSALCICRPPLTWCACRTMITGAPLRTA